MGGGKWFHMLKEKRRRTFQREREPASMVVASINLLRRKVSYPGTGGKRGEGLHLGLK